MCVLVGGGGGNTWLALCCVDETEKNSSSGFVLIPLWATIGREQTEENYQV